MSKQYYTTTAQFVRNMITEINEEVTAVTMQNVSQVRAIILESIHEDAEELCNIVAEIEAWIMENAKSNSITGAQFKANLNNLHSQDLDLFEATTDEVYDAYTARFGEPADFYQFQVNLSLWKRQQTYA